MTEINSSSFTPVYNQNYRMRIAIDGPAGAGKSTAAQRVAQILGYIYIDTGAMYRCIAWAVREKKIAPNDINAVSTLATSLDVRLMPATEQAEGHVYVDGHNVTALIRTPEISHLTSQISGIASVRQRLLTLQRSMAVQGGVVMEGRDIGTVVLPDAEIKVFLTASVRKRALRRRAELAEKNIPVSVHNVLKDITERDARDSARDLAPMVPAIDAVILDSDHLDVDGVVSKILALYQKACDRSREIEQLDNVSSRESN